MSATTDFYLARAAENAQAARDTNLVNVRERCLRAEIVWRQMADRLLGVEQKKRQHASAIISAGDRPANDVPWPIAPLKRSKKPTN